MFDILKMKFVWKFIHIHIHTHTSLIIYLRIQLHKKYDYIRKYSNMRIQSRL